MVNGTKYRLGLICGQSEGAGYIVTQASNTSVVVAHGREGCQISSVIKEVDFIVKLLKANTVIDRQSWSPPQ